MSTFLSLGVVLIAVNSQSATPPLGAPASQIVYEDKSREVTVELSGTDEAVTFSSHLPAGWTFDITVDGNQDGKWGYGAGMPDPKQRTTADRKFGQHSRNGIFCSQYVFTTFEGDPTQVQTSSQCGDLPSKGSVIISGFDVRERATISFRIPADEFFGNSRSANIQVCVWDTARWSCQHRLPELLVVSRT